MSNQELPVVITAISDAQFEGFVSGTLFAQGWSVVFRAIDTEAIERYWSNNVEQASSSLGKKDAGNIDSKSKADNVDSMFGK